LTARLLSVGSGGDLTLQAELEPHVGFGGRPNGPTISISTKLLRTAPCPVIAHPRRIDAQEGSVQSAQVSTTV